MQFAKIATAAALAMGVTTFAVAQERVSPNDQLNRSAPAASPGTDHNQIPGNTSPPSTNMNSSSGATGSDTRASTGAMSGPISEKNVAPMLQQQGYTDVKGIKRSGDLITADAKKDGKSVKLRVDAKTGKVSEGRS
jgi:hypothetical protein